MEVVRHSPLNDWCRQRRCRNGGQKSGRYTDTNGKKNDLTQPVVMYTRDRVDKPAPERTHLLLNKDYEVWLDRCNKFIQMIKCDSINEWPNGPWWKM